MVVTTARNTHPTAYRGEAEGTVCLVGQQGWLVNDHFLVLIEADGTLVVYKWDAFANSANGGNWDAYSCEALPKGVRVCAVLEKKHTKDAVFGAVMHQSPPPSGRVIGRMLSIVSNPFTAGLVGCGVAHVRSERWTSGVMARLGCTQQPACRCSSDSDSAVTDAIQKRITGEESKS